MSNLHHTLSGIGNKSDRRSTVASARLAMAVEQMEGRRLFSGLTLAATLVDPTPQDYQSGGAFVASRGNLLLVGLPATSVDVDGDDNPEYAVGEVQVFDTTTGSMVKTFASPTQTAGDNFGAAVAFTADGKIAISAPTLDPNGGGIGKVFVYDDLSDAEPTVLLNPDPSTGPAQEIFGSRLFALGNDILVQTALDSQTLRGVVTRFDLDGTNAPQFYTNPAPTGAGDAFGDAAAVSPDGTRILFSATDTSSFPFEGKLYELNAADGSLIRTISEPAATFSAYHGFGSQIVWSGNNIFVSAPSADPEEAVGAGYVYQFSDATGDVVQTYTSTDDQVTYGVSFGAGLAVSNDGATVAIGSPYQNRRATVDGFDENGEPQQVEAEVSSGVTYVYNVASGSLVQTLENPVFQPTFTPPGSPDTFGVRVAPVGTSGFAISNPYADPGTSTDTGAVYVFKSVVTPPANQAPTAVAGGPYAINESAGVTLDGVQSSDPDNDTLTFAWDVNGDGTTDATGATPTLSPSQLAALGLNDDGTFAVTLTVDDGQGHVVSNTTSLTVANVAPTLTSLTGPADGIVGHTFTYAAAATDPGADALTYNWALIDASNVTIATGTGDTFSVTPAVGSFTVALTVSDGDGGVATGLVGLTVAPPPNVAPTANAGGPYTINEGSGVTLNGSGSSDPDNDALIYAWDVNGDDTIDATGVSPTLSPAQLATLGLNDDGTFVVKLTVNDGHAHSASATSSLVVLNVAPTLTSLTGPTTGQTGQTFSYTAAATDPGADVLSYGWTVKNASNVVVATGNGTGFSYTPAVAGSFTIALSVTDGDGGAAAGSVALTVVAPPPPAGPTAVIDGSGNLVVTGTSGSESIELHKAATGSGVVVVFNNVVYATLTPTGDVLIDGGAGNDTITVAESLTRATVIHGGAGNDTIIGGGGTDYLFGDEGNDYLSARGSDDVAVGGAGTDLLTGGAGRDLLIGGTGADLILGNRGEDILIASYTSYDNNLVALKAIQREWLSAGSYTTRVNNLRNGGGLNGSYKLDTDVTVFDDGVIDILSGGDDRDWFIIQANGNLLARDLILDPLSSEFKDDLAAYGR